MKNIKSFLLKIFNFYNFKNLHILHGQVFVMVIKNNVKLNSDYHCRNYLMQTNDFQNQHKLLGNFSSSFHEALLGHILSYDRD